MTRVLPLFCAVLLLAGCSVISPPSNQPPEAYIDSVSPEVVAEGETIAFAGQGSDEDGEVVGYEWRSDLDGLLSNSASFQTSSLSEGEHVISFMVQDNSDEWSSRTQVSVVVLPATGTSSIPLIIFDASPSTIDAGATATLTWNVSGATSVTISPDVGTVPASGFAEVTPEATTTYTLTATSGGSTATATTTVTLHEAESSLFLTPDEELSGYIRSSGVERTIGVYVGDDDANRGIQGFLTYRITKIPDDATITRVILDLSGYDLPYDPPYPELGCLRAFEHEYGDIGDQYFRGDLGEPIAEWCDFAAIDNPAGIAGLRDALQKQVGEGKFQFRLQFSDSQSDFDDVRDMLHWDRGAMPTLTVEYSTPD
ncbi:PKD domain-containing protein [Chloroflexota bacterium]